MAERSNAAVLKTVVLLPWDRGFESLFLRRANATLVKARVFCFYGYPSCACTSEENHKNMRSMVAFALQGLLKWDHGRSE